MPTNAFPIEQLHQIAAQFRHLRNEHKREGEHGRTRRDIGARLAEFENRFQTLLEHWVSDEAAREAWHEHFYRGGAEPTDDLARNPPVFVGRSGAGSELRIVPGANREHDVTIDGVRVDRTPSTLSIPMQGTVHIQDQDWREVSLAPSAAVNALRSYCATANGTPPWQWARALFEDGLIDVNFGLTARGRRIVNAP